MNRRDASTALISLVALHTAAFAQPRNRLPTIGYLGFRASPNELDEAFVAALGELGYAVGRNIVLERRFAGASAQKLHAFGAELVAMKPDILMASSFQSASVLASLTKTIPIIFMANADPVGAGLVASLARPGGNITGFATLAGDLGAKQIELLKAVVPRLSRLAMLVNPSNGGNAFVIRSVELGARPVGVSVQIYEAANGDAIDAAFAAMAAARMDAVTLAIDGFYIQEAQRIAALAVRHKLPSMTPQRVHADAGSLMSYGSPLIENFRRAATYVDKILKGAKPGELPVEQPTTVELVINLRTAKALKLLIPQSLLLRADAVIA